MQSGVLTSREWKDTQREKPLGFSEKPPKYCVVERNSIYCKAASWVLLTVCGCSSSGERTWHPLPFSQLSKSSYILMFTPELSPIYSPITRPLQHMSFCELWSFLGLQGLLMFEAGVPTFLPF